MAIRIASKTLCNGSGPFGGTNSRRIAVARSIGRFVPSVFGRRMFQSRLTANLDGPAGILRKFQTIQAPLSIQYEVCSITIPHQKSSFASLMLMP
jgi:hypothetical protein